MQRKKQDPKSEPQKKKVGPSKEPAGKGPKHEKHSKERIIRSNPWAPSKEPLVKKPLPQIPVLKAPKLPVVPIKKPESSAGPSHGTGARRPDEDRKKTPTAPSTIPIASNLMNALEQVTIIPSKSVTFYPNDKRQQTYLVIQNESNIRIMFKMKSTRPTLYKMKPVFGIVHPREKFSVRLVYKGIKAGNRIPTDDRFTVVVATYVEKSMEQWKKGSDEDPHEMKKRLLKILYTGVNDKVEAPPPVPSAEVKVPTEVKVSVGSKEEQKVESKVALKTPKPKPEPKVPKKAEKKVPPKAVPEVTPKVVSEKVSTEEVKASQKAQWLEVQEHDRLWMKKLLQREDRFMDTAEEEPRAKALRQAMLPPMEDAELKSLIKEERRSYLDGYYDGYKAGLTEDRSAKEGDLIKSVMDRLSAREDNNKNRAYKIGFIEGYHRARLLKASYKDKSVMKALEQMAAKEVEGHEKKDGTLVSDGTNVRAKTPGGGEPSESPFLIDPLQKRDIVHITRTGKKKYFIVMYRDPKMPENLMSRSGDEEDSNSPTSNQRDGTLQTTK